MYYFNIVSSAIYSNKGTVFHTLKGENCILSLTCFT